MAVIDHRAELERAGKRDDYNDYAKALFGFEESFELWTGNANARWGVSAARLAYAESAYRKGDFDLGLSLLKEDDPSHQDLRRQLRAAQEERDARQHRLRTAKRLVIALAAGVFLAITVLAINLVGDRLRDVLNPRLASHYGV